MAGVFIATASSLVIAGIVGLIVVGFGPIFFGLYALFCCIYVLIAFRELKVEKKKEIPQAEQLEEQKE